MGNLMTLLKRTSDAENNYDSFYTILFISLTKRKKNTVFSANVAGKEYRGN